MIDIRGCTKEEKIEKLIDKILLNNINLNFYLLDREDPPTFEEMNQFFDKFLDKIYFISESPMFEYKSRNFECQTIAINDIDVDCEKILNHNTKSAYIFYNLIANTGSRGNKYFLLRGVFIEDESIIREDKINQVLDEE